MGFRILCDVSYSLFEERKVSASQSRTYGKIEGKSRKTDGFMALVAAMTVETELDEAPAGNINSLPVLAF